MENVSDSAPGYREIPPAYYPKSAQNPATKIVPIDATNRSHKGRVTKRGPDSGSNVAGATILGTETAKVADKPLSMASCGLGIR